MLVVVLAIGGLIFWNVRSSAANDRLGAALDVYTTPLAIPGAPPEPGVYTTAARAPTKPIASLWPSHTITAGCPKATKARYFAGVTYEELGENGNAETELKAAAGSWDRNLANLAKLALAGLYHQTSRDSQAIDLYNEFAAKPSATVSPGVAQLDLADLYAAEGKQDQARALWAKVKDADKDGAAGESPRKSSARK